MKLRIFLFLVVFLFVTNLTSQKVESASEHGPFNAFDVFPLKGTSKLKDIISLKSSNSRTKYKVSRPYELICKANVLVENYPPRVVESNGSIGVFANTTNSFVRVLFDPFGYLNEVNPIYSSDYISQDVVCGNYWDKFIEFTAQGYKTGGVNQMLPLSSIIYLRYMQKYPNSYGYKGNWCRAPIIGLRNGIFYRTAIANVKNANLVYWADTGRENCTNNWSDVKQWQKEGWYLIK